VIDRVTGPILEKGAEAVVVGVSGIGLRLEASATTLRDLPSVGQEATLFAHLHVREDALQLFGFSSEEERALFLLLIGVSKIGPRLALAALSARRPREVRKAIALGEVSAFQAVPGIGKKTAERLILELREKVGELVPLAAGEASAGTAPSAGDANLYLAREALLELGLPAAEADMLLRGQDAEQPVSDLIRQALAARR
jgi:holliday junction DNA helicase RuvA